jgi:hypothetical protein
LGWKKTFEEMMWKIRHMENEKYFYAHFGREMRWEKGKLSLPALLSGIIKNYSSSLPIFSITMKFYWQNFHSLSLEGREYVVGLLDEENG